MYNVVQYSISYSPKHKHIAVVFINLLEKLDSSFIALILKYIHFL